MTKNDFLDQLRTILTGELPDSEVESNIRFYDDYIKSKTVADEENVVMVQLGDPRLIAKTIIETYQISHTPFYNNTKHERSYQEEYTGEANTYRSQQGNRNDESNNYGKTDFRIHTSLNWYQKLIITLILILAIIILVIIGGIVLRLFFSIGFPLIIIYLVYKMVKNNARR
jgi:uncharacterized membrane protein